MTKLMLVGGFLGAGKTTTLSRLAKHFTSLGLRVGLITNDQAAGLVDTERFRAQGHRVEEVAGACFCCSFDDLISQAAKLAVETDIVLAEPVGSCTDLAATVSAPILKYHGRAFDLMPYSVLVDPVLVEALIVNHGEAGFPAEVGYIFRKQLEEADVICLNKTDQLTEEHLAQLLWEMSHAFPQANVIPISALTGDGFDVWLRLLTTSLRKVHITDVDYDVYAKGEAALGWLNLSADIASTVSRVPNAFAMTFTSQLSKRLEYVGARIAHIKVMVTGEHGFALAHRTAGNTHTILSVSSSQPMTCGKLLINARAVIDPEILTREVLGIITEGFGETLHVDHIVSRSFRPGRPVPIHRLTQV